MSDQADYTLLATVVNDWRQRVVVLERERNDACLEVLEQRLRAEAAEGERDALQESLTEALDALAVADRGLAHAQYWRGVWQREAVRYAESARAAEREVERLRTALDLAMPSLFRLMALMNIDNHEAQMDAYVEATGPFQRLREALVPAQPPACSHLYVDRDPACTICAPAQAQASGSEAGGGTDD